MIASALTFSSKSHELAYMRYVAQNSVSAAKWRCCLSLVSVLVALSKFLLITGDSQQSVRWLSSAGWLALLALAQLAMLVSVTTSRAWFLKHYEQLCVGLEACAALCSFWWLTVLWPCELMPVQTPFTVFVFRGCLMLYDQLRLVTAIPMLLFELSAVAWLELRVQPSVRGLLSLVPFVVLGQLVPLCLLLYMEAQRRWRFIQQPGQRLDLGSLGGTSAWADIIELGCVLQLRVARLPHSTAHLLSVTVLLGLAAVLLPQLLARL